MAESVRHNLVGHYALMPGMGKAEDTFRASHCMEKGYVSQRSCLFNHDDSFRKFEIGCDLRLFPTDGRELPNPEGVA